MKFIKGNRNPKKNYSPKLYIYSHPEVDRIWSVQTYSHFVDLLWTNPYILLHSHILPTPRWLYFQKHMCYSLSLSMFSHIEGWPSIHSYSFTHDGAGFPLWDVGIPIPVSHSKFVIFHDVPMIYPVFFLPLLIILWVSYISYVYI